MFLLDNRNNRIGLFLHFIRRAVELIDGLQSAAFALLLGRRVHPDRGEPPGHAEHALVRRFVKTHNRVVDNDLFIVAINVIVFGLVALELDVLVVTVVVHVLVGEARQLQLGGFDFELVVEDDVVVQIVVVILEVVDESAVNDLYGKCLFDICLLVYALLEPEEPYKVYFPISLPSFFLLKHR